MKIFKSGRGNYLYAEVSLWGRMPGNIVWSIVEKKQKM